MKHPVDKKFFLSVLCYRTEIETVACFCGEELSRTITAVEVLATVTPVITRVVMALSGLRNSALAIALGACAIKYLGVPPLIVTSRTPFTATVTDVALAFSVFGCC
jgi:hypothetical protein